MALIRGVAVLHRLLRWRLCGRGMERHDGGWATVKLLEKSQIERWQSVPLHAEQSCLAVVAATAE